MVNTHKWHERYVCPECGWHIIYNLDDMIKAFRNERIFHEQDNRCKECGCTIITNSEKTEKGTTYYCDWKKALMKKVYAGIWWKPWTWFNCSWQTREGVLNKNVEFLKRCLDK